MEIAILGLKQSGKSTLFQIMTGVNSKESYGEVIVKGVAKIPDWRFDKLVSIFKPKKETPAVIPFMDINISEKNEWDETRKNIGSSDGIVHVIDAFTSNDISEIAKRYKNLEDEMIFSDLITVEKRLERISKLSQKALKHEEALQIKLLPEFKSLLEQGKPLRTLQLSKDKMAAIKSFSFCSLKPELVVLNIEEGGHDLTEEFKRATALTENIICISCEAELQISQLPQVDRQAFLDSFGIKTPAFESVIRTAFMMLDRIYYFTVGEDEVRAWVIVRGSTAPTAAGAIHKDFERGFIKAEVIGYDEFITCNGSLLEAKSKGKMRLEGKEYIVRDGDIISFRFNV